LTQFNPLAYQNVNTSVIPNAQLIGASTAPVLMVTGPSDLQALSFPVDSLQRVPSLAQPGQIFGSIEVILIQKSRVVFRIYKSRLALYPCRSPCSIRQQMNSWLSPFIRRSIFLLELTVAPETHTLNFFFCLTEGLNKDGKRL